MSFWTMVIVFWVVMLGAVAVEVVWKYKSEPESVDSPWENGAHSSDPSDPPVGQLADTPDRAAATSPAAESVLDLPA